MKKKQVNKILICLLKMIKIISFLEKNKIGIDFETNFLTIKKNMKQFNL